MTAAVCRCGAVVEQSIARGRPRLYCSSSCRCAAKNDRRPRRPCSECHGPTSYTVGGRTPSAPIVCRSCRTRRRKSRRRRRCRVMKWVCIRCGQRCSRQTVHWQMPKYCTTECRDVARWQRRRARIAAAATEIA